MKVQLKNFKRIGKPTLALFQPKDTCVLHASFPCLWIRKPVYIMFVICVCILWLLYWDNVWLMKQLSKTSPSCSVCFLLLIHIHIDALSLLKVDSPLGILLHIAMYLYWRFVENWIFCMYFGDYIMYICFHKWLFSIHFYYHPAIII